MKIYFAAPLFSQAEVEFNQNLTDHIEKSGFSVFLPQRDGVEKQKPSFDKMIT
jgi:nucleoside 2-deoxyribosyltransferase